LNYAFVDCFSHYFLTCLDEEKTDNSSMKKNTKSHMQTNLKETLEIQQRENKKLRKELLVLRREKCSDEADNINFGEMDHADLDRAMGCSSTPSIVDNSVVSKQSKFSYLVTDILYKYYLFR
jgi:hypothetical protein